MTAQTSFAPATASTGKIDLTHNTLADKLWSVCCHDFSDKFVAGGTRETVIAPKKFQIGVADASAQEANDRIALRPPRLSCLSYRCATFFKVDCDHAG